MRLSLKVFWVPPASSHTPSLLLWAIGHPLELMMQLRGLWRIIDWDTTCLIHASLSLCLFLDCAIHECIGCSLIVALCANFTLVWVDTVEYFFKLRNLLRVNAVSLLDEPSADASLMATRSRRATRARINALRLVLVEATRDRIYRHSLSDLLLITAIVGGWSEALGDVALLASRVIGVVLLVNILLVTSLFSGCLLHCIAWRGGNVALLEQLKANELLFIDIALQEQLLDPRLFRLNRVLFLLLWLDQIAYLIDRRVILVAVIRAVLIRSEGLILRRPIV